MTQADPSLPDQGSASNLTGVVGGAEEFEFSAFVSRSEHEANLAAASPDVRAKLEAAMALSAQITASGLPVLQTLSEQIAAMTISGRYSSTEPADFARPGRSGATSLHAKAGLPAAEQVREELLRELERLGAQFRGVAAAVSQLAFSAVIFETEWDSPESTTPQD